MGKTHCMFFILPVLVIMSLFLPIQEKSILFSVQSIKNQRIKSMPSTFHLNNFGIKSIDSWVIWNKTFGGTQQNYAFSLVQTSDNGFAVAGGTFSSGAGDADSLFFKTDSLGNTQFNLTFGGIGDDEAHCIIRTLDGGYAILGTTDSFGAGGYDFWLVKTHSSGRMLWNKTYGGSGTDDGWSLKQTADGSLVLAGWTTSFGIGGGDFWLIKTDSSGMVLWNKTYGGVFLDFARCVQQTSDGGYAILGNTYSFGIGRSDFWLVKTDGLGNEQWNRTYGGTMDDFGFSLIEAQGGGYALAGSTSSFGKGVYDFWLVRTNGFGSTMWSKTYGGAAYDEAWTVSQTSTNRFILTGWTESFGAGSSDCWLIGTDALGNPVGNITWGGTDYDYVYSAIICADGNIVLAGETQSYDGGGTDSLLLKVSGISDVAVINVTILKTIIGQGYTTNINITSANKGIFAETFDVTLYANATSVTSKTLTLAGGEYVTTNFILNTIGFYKGNYTISAYAWPVLGETYIIDNNFDDGFIIVAMVGDITSNSGWPDGRVDMSDVYIVCKKFGANYPNPKYNFNCDIVYDLRIDMGDIYVVAKRFGKIDP